ncbi:MAG: DUF6522 family protein [Octadecabacter sp.]|nr:DUF6522 family protein [Octadecabacter sp.]
MIIDMTNAQSPTIDAQDLGQIFGIEPAQVQSLMRAGKITSLFETGTDEHAGRFRLTFSYANKRVCLTCDASGRVLSTVRTPISPLDIHYETEHS